MSYEQYSQKWQQKKIGGKHPAHDFLEKPAIFSLLKNLKSKSVLCLGCGSGEECKRISSLGADRVIGVEKAKSLYFQAKNTFSNLEFINSPIEFLQFENQSFDLIFSSLTLHYLENWPEFFSKAKNWLKPEGRFVFSVHHPVKWGGKTIRNKDFNSFILGYKKIKDRPKKRTATNHSTNFWPDDENSGSVNFEIYGDYLNFRKISDILFGELKIDFYHRSFSQMFTEIIASGFAISSVIEPKPLPQTQKTHPDFYETYSKIPLFLIFELTLP